MRLELHKVRIKNVSWGDGTEVRVGPCSSTGKDDSPSPKNPGSPAWNLNSPAPVRVSGSSPLRT